MDRCAEVRHALCHFLYPADFLLQPDELTSLLVVMLYDLQDRKFQAREIFDEEEPVAEVRKIERYLYRYTCSEFFLLIPISRNTDLSNCAFFL